MEFDGRTVIVTGASGHLGRAVAGAFAQRGARLVLAARSIEALEARFGAEAAARAYVAADLTKQAGAEVLTGGEREGSVWRPTVLANLRDDLRVSCEEVFAPLVGVNKYTDVESAIDAAARSEFGLQGGLFTNDVRVIERAFDRIDVGGLMVNDVSTYRIDHMPYGGVKSSGAGREGLRYAIEEMTELKLLTINTRQ